MDVSVDDVSVREDLERRAREGQWLPPAQLQVLLGCTHKSVHRLIDSGKLRAEPRVPGGKHLIVDPVTVIAVLEEWRTRTGMTWPTRRRYQRRGDSG
jgi:hypothetical protein